MTKYISYRRVSTKRQGKSGLGLESQDDIIRHYYPDIEKDFVEVESGKSVKNRKVLKEAIEYCHKTGAVMVVAKVDRLARNAKEGLEIYEELGEKIIFCDLPKEGEVKLMLTMYFAFAELEVKLISVRIKGALARAKAKGQKLGVHNPVKKRQPFRKEWSIRGSESKREMAIDNEVNVRAYNHASLLRKGGMTLSDIAQELNKAKFRTVRRGKKWSKGTVSKLLKRGGVTRAELNPTEENR